MVTEGIRDRVCPSTCVYLSIDVGDVAFNRSDAEEQLVGNFFVTAACGNEAQDLCLSPCEPVRQCGEPVRQCGFRDRPRLGAMLQGEGAIQGGLHLHVLELGNGEFQVFQRLVSLVGVVAKEKLRHI